jgi:hypothetical protein
MGQTHVYISSTHVYNGHGHGHGLFIQIGVQYTQNTYIHTYCMVLYTAKTGCFHAHILHFCIIIAYICLHTVSDVDASYHLRLC